MKTNILLMVLISFVSACSTFKGVVNGGDSEDYNKLTYGSKNSNWDVRTPVETPRGQNSFNEREPSSTDDQANNEELDATDDHVRSKIEENRGLSVAKYAQGDRATREDFYDRSPGDGSLWTGENDSNYFYSKTKVRASGDIVSVKVEDELVRHVGEEIKKSLSPAEQEVEMALYLKNNSAAKDNKDLEAYRNVASDDLKSVDAEEVKTRMEKAVRWSQVDLSKTISLKASEDFRAEIIDRFPNGNYKIRATKRILYRGSSKLVSMVAVAPAADFDDTDTIKSGKLYEYKVRVAR